MEARTHCHLGPAFGNHELTRVDCPCEIMTQAGVTNDGAPDQITASSVPSTPNTPLPSATVAPEDVTGKGKENKRSQESSTRSTDAVPQRPTEAPLEFDDFGLPIRPRAKPEPTISDSSEGNDRPHTHSSTPEPKEATSSATDSPPEQDVNQLKDIQGQPGATTGKEEPEKQASNLDKDSESPTPADTAAQKPDPEAIGAVASPRSSTSKHKNVEFSEWSHMRIAQPHQAHDDSEEEEEEPADWKAMPALGEFDYYDDYGRLIARGAHEEDNDAVYQGLGGAGRGYTRVQLDEDAQSATSMDEDTSYLFKDSGHNTAGLVGEELRDSVSQLQATKDLLNETQKIAYVGVVRLAIHEMNLELSKLPVTRSTRKTHQKASDSTRKWGQAMMGRLYMHMDINSAEQIMIEQLAEHGVQPGDLVRPLMQNARVKNPMAEDVRKSSSSVSLSSRTSKGNPRSRMSGETDASSELDSPPPYEAHEDDEPTEVKTPSQMPTSDQIDIDLRWTVLCDLFLVLIADSTYDARSRTLLERVGESMDVTWLQICRFEKRVTDALEMQEHADKENWDETEHMEERRQKSRKTKYMVMGLATVGGGLVIGLSAGLLAPVIGAGLAAGLTTVGIGGTSTFLGGLGGTALIASSATLGGSAIGMRASHRRTGAVQTFEYRPLHNNKKVNLIVTVSGWMTGKVDDVRLPYSTVDPIMGDIYSVLWEPEMLRSMGDTINILATEVTYSPNTLETAHKADSLLGIDPGSTAGTRKYYFDGTDGVITITSRPDQTRLLD